MAEPSASGPGAPINGPILKISSCFNEACSKTHSKRPSSARNTTTSLSSDETVSSSDLASARSSCTSSGYSGMSSLCECFEVQVTSTPMFTRRRERGSIAQLFTDTDIPGAISSPDDKETTSLASQPSLKMIRRLKRLSDAWSNVSRCTDDIIIDRLKKGREEAIKKQTYLEELLNEASSQYGIQQQAQALLQICSDENAVDEVEAERIILLAGERYKSYHEEAERIVSDLGPSTWESLTRSTLNKESYCPATLYISDIKLKLSEKFKNHLQTSPKDHTHHFLCLMKEKKTKGIIATQILSTQSHNTGPVLHFSNRLTLPEIPPNFNLSIEVYHMSSEDKLKNKKNKLSRVLSTVKRVPSLKRYRYLSCTGDVTEDASSNSAGAASASRQDAIQSSFQFAGSTAISKEEFFSSRVHEISGGEVASSVELVVNADPLYLNSTVEGYLNVCLDAKWERRWFALNESCLSCWLYRDQQQQKEGPLCEWLIDDCYKLAYSASSEKCAWKHAFVLPLSTNSDIQELRLAAHASEQAQEWMTALNSIITSNIEWSSHKS